VWSKIILIIIRELVHWCYRKINVAAPFMWFGGFLKVERPRLFWSPHIAPTLRAGRMALQGE